MRRRTLIALLVGHAMLLVLASTNFSAVSWLWGDLSWNCTYFQYAYRNGWGHTYVSDYGLGQVLCYVAAYGLGAAAFGIAWLRLEVPLSAVATVLCLAGAVSFGIEATHWLWAHHLSLIASFPAVMVVLWVCVAAQLGRICRRDTRSSHPVEA